MTTYPITHVLPQWSLASDAEIQRLHDAAIDYLCRRGYVFQCPEVLDALQRLGATVDRAAMRATPTRQMVDILEQCARREKPEMMPQILRQAATGKAHVGHNHTCFHDAATQTTRRALLSDLRDVAMAWHMTDAIGTMNTCMTAQDVPVAIEPIVAMAQAMRITPKAVACPEMMLQEQLPYLEELQSIATDSPAKFDGSGCSMTRFTMDERAGGCLMAVHRRHGLKSWWVNSTPIAGASAPVSVAGTALVGIAETIGGWLAGWALNPQVWLWAIPLCGVLDMRSGRVLFSTPETILADSLMFQYFHRMYGMKVGLCMGYTDAKVPGIQAFNDKLLKGLAYGLFTGALGGQSGTLDAGKTYSPAQQLIDLDLNRQIAQLARGAEVSEATLCVGDVMERAGVFDGMFLDTEYTLAHHREEIWSPSLLDRSPFETGVREREKDQAIVEAAERRWRKAVADYRPIDLPAEKRRAIDAVEESARRNLL